MNDFDQYDIGQEADAQAEHEANMNAQGEAEAQAQSQQAEAEAMEEMECWSVDNHLAKCDKHKK